MNRRQTLRLLAASGGAALLTACAAPAPSSPTTPGTPVAKSASTPTPRSGGTLRLGTLGDLVTLDGHASGPFDTLYQVWDLLGVEDEKLNLTPVLAESLDWSADARQLKFNLHKGVTWHTGREFTSDDVRWNLERVRDPKVGGGILASYVKPLTAIETPDKSTIVLKSDDPWPGVFDFIQHLNMIDPVTAQGPDGPNKPVGTGPFMFAEYAQGDHLRLTKNKDYWRSSLPYLDEIVFTIFRDPQSMAAQFEAGALDGVLTPTLRDTQRYQQDPTKFQVLLNRPAGDALMILCNCTVEPTNNKQLRQALDYALDRQRIVDTVLLGISRPMDLPYLPPSPAFDESKNAYYTFDLDKARALLQSANISNLELNFNFTSTSTEFSAIAQIYAADLAKIGVKLNLVPTEPVTLTQQLVTQKYSGLASATSLYGSLHPGLMSGNPYYNPLNNWSGFHDPTYTDLATAITVEVDPARQQQVYAHWRDFVLDQAFSLPIAQSVPRTVVSPRVHGLQYTMAEMLKATEAWLDVA
ncbi:MAG: ABC transporter substrate-binding protein [Chloroflexi bacterium]|nr:ABC transporter substrate-binding protein [Chloroflexota bacterium]